jgi:hypothetical protein
MLVLSLAILITLIGSIAIFAVLESVLGWFLGNSTSDAFDVVWAGFLLQGGLLLGISLIAPINIWTWMVMMGGVGLSLLNSTRIRNRLFQSLRQILERVGWKGPFLVLIGVGIYGSQSPCNYDTLLYHHQSTQWYTKYGSVQGVALLHYRLGFISSAFTLAAPFESLFPHRSATLVNSIALLLTLLQIVAAIGNIASGRGTRQDVFWCCGFSMVLPMHLLFLDPASAAPDFLVNVATVSIAGAILTRIDGERGWNVAVLTAAILLPLVKLSAAPVALLVCIDAILRCREDRKNVFVVTVGVGVLALAALIGTSWRQTGNLVFPIPALQRDVAWGVEPDMVHEVSQEIRSWARWGGPRPENKIESEWFMAWIRSSKGILFMAAAFGNAAALVLIGLRSRGRLRCDHALVIPCVGLLGTLYMLYSAPNPRFGFGMLILGWCWIGQELVFGPRKRFLVHSRLGTRNWGTYVQVAAAMVILLVLIGIGVLPIDPWRRALNAFSKAPLVSAADGRLNWYKPAAVPNIGYERSATGHISTAFAIEFERAQVNDVEYIYPVNTDVSGSQSIPCSLQKRIDIKLADPERGIAAGFVRGQMEPYRWYGRTILSNSRLDK